MGQLRPKRSFRTARCVTPESNHTSRMLPSFSTLREPQASHTARSPKSSSTVRLHQIDDPSELSPTLSAKLRTRSGVRLCAPQSRHLSAGTGTPQTLCRLMHQSDRSRTMLWMRSRPQSGIQRTSFSMTSRALSLNLETAMNHWSVARKITGFLQRQQCG